MRVFEIEIDSPSTKDDDLKFALQGAASYVFKFLWNMSDGTQEMSLVIKEHGEVIPDTDYEFTPEEEET